MDTHAIPLIIPSLDPDDRLPEILRQEDDSVLLRAVP